jgi:hypothetical protein
MHSSRESQAKPSTPLPPGRVWKYVVCYPRGEGAWTQISAAAPPPVVSARVLAEKARDELTLPRPRPGSSPAEGSLVNLPTYLFISGQGWRPMTATAAVTGTSVTVTATPDRVEWSIGERRSDGRAAVTCRGPGEPHRAGGRAPSCGYQFRQSSAKQLGSATPGYLLTARAVWTIRWECTGNCDTASGVLDPLTPTGQFRLPVYEARSQLVSPQ